MEKIKSVVWNPGEILAQLPARDSGKERYTEPYIDGDTSLGMYAPAGHDPQEPHSQDEFYFVVSGTGIFVHGDERTAFGPGDALFVAAGVVHRFEDFSDDFATWVVFVGEPSE